MLQIEIGWEPDFVRGDLIIDADVHGKGMGLVAAVDGFAPGAGAIIYVIFKRVLRVYH